MQTINSKLLFSEAEKLLSSAHSELNRSESDAVTHLICSNSRQSIANFLSGYLMEKGGHLPYPTTLEGLLERCQAFDPRFKQLDFTSIHCRFSADDKNYCLDHETVGECYRIAKEVQVLVNS